MEPAEGNYLPLQATVTGERLGFSWSDGARDCNRWSMTARYSVQGRMRRNPDVAWSILQRDLRWEGGIGRIVASLLIDIETGKESERERQEEGERWKGRGLAARRPLTGAGLGEGEGDGRNIWLGRTDSRMEEERIPGIQWR